MHKEPGPTHDHDPVLSRQVEAMAGYGVPLESIAMVLGVDRGLLERTYEEELRTGAIKANARVAESLFRKATGEGAQSVAAAVFWLKTRAGWKETTVQELGGSDGSPLMIVRHIVDPKNSDASNGGTLIEAPPPGSQTGQD